MEIYERFKEVRKHLGLSQTAFAERLGSNRDVINNIENNRLKNPQQKEPLYRLLCKVFNVNENWLYAGEGEMFVHISRENQLMQWAGEVLSEETDSFRRRFVAALSVLDERDWKEIERLLMKMTGELSEKEQ